MLGGMSRDAAIAQAQNQAYMNEQQLGTDRFLGKMDDRSTREIAELENTGMLGDTISLTTGKKKTGFGGRGSFLDFRTQAKKAKRGLYDIFSAPFGDGEEQYEEAPYRIGAPEFTSKYPETKGASLHGDTSPSMASNISKGREHPITGETKGHQGRDFGVPQGTKLIAPFDGVVSRVGSLEGGPGRYIAIKKKGDSREAKIFHMSKISLNPGTKIKKGETVLGLSGGTPGTKGAGSSTGPHTHVEWWDKAEKESRNVYPPLGADYQGTFVPGANKGVLLDIQDMPGVIPREAKKQEQVAQAKKPKATTVESASYGTGGALGPPAPTANPMQGLLNEVVDSTPGMQNWLNNQEEERERRKEFLGLHEQAAAAQEEALSPGAQNAITYGSTETEPGVGTLPPADSWEEDPRTGKYIPSYSIAQKAPDDPLADQIKEGFGNIGLREAGLAAGAIFGGEEGRREGAQALGGNLGGMAGGALAASINPALAPVGKFVGTALGSKLGGETMGSGGKHYESRKEGRKRPQRTRIALSAPYGSLSGYYSRMRGE
jgi:murein DD-endopeptidase MepM/ murein hydrolase activator NlpD